MAVRTDLLDYLRRYRATPQRKLIRVERWRRRELLRGDIVAIAEALAGDLHAAGIGAGDRVGIYIKDGPLWVAALFGALRAGAVAVPIDVAHPPELVLRLVSRLDLRAWIGDAELPRLDLDLPMLEPSWSVGVSPPVLPPTPVDDSGRVAQVVLTSGTTDLPLSVEVRHENMRAVLDTLEAEISTYRWLVRVAPRLRLAVALPLSHLYGQFMGVLIPVTLGADVAVFDTLPASELAAAVRRERAWALASVPYTLSSLANHLMDEGRRVWGEEGLERRLEQAAHLSWPRRCRMFDRLRGRLGRRLVAVVSGGATLDADTERLWKLLGYIVIQGYGLTEAAPLVTLNHPFHARPGSVGKPLPGVEVRVAGNGEILVRGANVATPSTGAGSGAGSQASVDGAAARGPRIDADGWLHTGDLGEVLEDGSIRFRSRISDRIVTPAGVNVDPWEVATALRATGEIVDAVVVERPWGAPGALCAVLVTYAGADVNACVRRVNKGLADAARLRSWFVWPYGDLPRTPTGKVRRGEVLA
jgi:long-chain acyl-CoA synthetase